MSCQDTCTAIGRYYKSLGQEYNDLFRLYCEESGMDDDDDFQEEMDNSSAECMLVDFDKNFPFKKPPANDEERLKFIYDLIKRCMADPDTKFGSSGRIPDFKSKELFTVTKEDREEVRAIYEAQCAKLYNNTWEADNGFLTILAIGKKHSFDYLLHLVDDFTRWRIQYPDKTDHTSQWAEGHPHFKQLLNISQTIGNKSIKYKELATGAVDSFSKRVCPKLQLQPMSKIDDDLETIVYYIKEAVNWVWSLATKREVKEKQLICPFQVDFCIAVGAPVSAESKEQMKPDEDPDEEDDDEDDDDDDDPKEDDPKDDEKWNDVVAGIKERLDANHLKYSKGERPQAEESRIFPDIYKKFEDEHKLEDSGNAAYLHKKRLIAMIDRRTSKKDVNKPDEIWMYEPPADCQNITNDTVPEWYINSSATCLCPKSDTRASFGATTHCKRGTLTLSFHVKEERIIKCYLFWNGQMMRFFPDDIKSVLPGLFNPKKQGKRDKAEEELLDAMIKEMKEKLVDEEFDEFVSSYK
eukprot:391795_1